MINFFMLQLDETLETDTLSDLEMQRRAVHAAKLLARAALPVTVVGGSALALGRDSATCASSGILHPLDSLWQTIEERRRNNDPKSSWTAKLLSRGVEKCSQKVGEEATEVVIEAIKGDRVGLIKESADLLYHLNVLWAAAGIEPADVYAELERRDGVSGLTEKASRPKQ